MSRHFALLSTGYTHLTPAARPLSSTPPLVPLPALRGGEGGGVSRRKARLWGIGEGDNGY